MTDRPDERSRDEIDREFTAIVAGLAAPSTDEPTPVAPPPVLPPPQETSSIIIPAEVWRAPTSDAAHEEDHFEPAPVTLPPGEDLSYWGAVLGIVGGPVIVLYAVLADTFKQTLWVTVGLAAFIGGFALMLWRQPARREDLGDDDGTRV